MLSYRTQGFNPYSVAYSPFFDSKIAVAAAANFGLVGNGRLYVLNLTDSGQILPQAYFDTQDGLFDLAWSEVHENQVVASSGDGTIKLFDLATASPPPPATGFVGAAAPPTAGKINFPIQVYKEHTREVFSVNWNLAQKHLFCTSSWDGTIKIWTPDRAQSISTFVAPVPDTTTIAAVPPAAAAGAPAQKQNNAHAPGSGPQSAMAAGAGGGAASGTGPSSIHSAMFSPHNPSIVASVHADSHVRVWDTRAYPALTHDFLGHAGLEALTLDWNKYRPTVLATGGVDKTIKIWDLRMVPGVDSNNSAAELSAGRVGMAPARVRHSIVAPVNELLGHDYAIRKIVWSPHSPEMLLSTSYDMTARVWRDMTAGSDTSGTTSRYMSRLNHGSGMVNVFHNHTEFVMGADWSLWGEPGWVATVGWDEMLHVWKAV
ncbi:uncharacterized protein SAPINGB_P003915 [Magnusiomyces paraingens]|uniref:Peroxin-7 n=1 Tax=Magnusiomyces paraingens TaxID=2606893 RepID=A0A5E8BX88_9ASCO|nr:uncharacterized protein SAPINGB_P003915 [Saprochaete ingens]VVT54117.1 unnamed protein product [Saprochaete ingens]